MPTVAWPSPPHDDRTVKVWDLNSGQDLRTLAGHAERVRSVAVSADGRLALSASDDHTVKVWDLTSGQELRTLAGHAYGVNSVAVSADGRLALSASDDRTVKVWDLETGNCLATLPLEGPLLSLALAPDGATVVVGDATGGVICLRLVLP